MKRQASSSLLDTLAELASAQSPLKQKQLLSQGQSRDDMALLGAANIALGPGAGLGLGYGTGVIQQVQGVGAQGLQGVGMHGNANTVQGGAAVQWIPPGYGYGYNQYNQYYHYYPSTIMAHSMAQQSMQGGDDMKGLTYAFALAEMPTVAHRPRAQSEPWLVHESRENNAHQEMEMIHCEDDEQMLPQMLDKYDHIYNKNGRIGVYTREERSAIINRFHEKRKRRVWKKKIRYHCRKNLADRRIRIKGRFVKAGDPSFDGYYYDDDDDDDEDGDIVVERSRSISLASADSGGSASGIGLTYKKPPKAIKSRSRSNSNKLSFTGIPPSLDRAKPIPMINTGRPFDPTVAATAFAPLQDTDAVIGSTAGKGVGVGAGAGAGAGLEAVVAEVAVEDPNAYMPTRGKRMRRHSVAY